MATDTARRLAERGHDVTALVPKLPAASSDEPDGPVRVRRVLKRGRLPLTITDVREIATHARRLGSSFDVMLAHGAMAAVGLSRAGLDAPLAFVYHASLPRELRFLRPRMPWGRERLVAYANEPISARVERTAVRRSARILVLSEFSRSMLVGDHPHQVVKVRLVSGGVDSASFHPGDGAAAAKATLGLDPSRRLLVTVRRAEPRMGIEQLLRAVPLVESSALQLAIAGGGPRERELQRLAGELGLDDRVIFLGKVTEFALRELYRAADLFVLPTVAYEGFGMVTVEALASGTPVVGTPVGATPEVLGPLDPRLVASGSDPHSLAAAIREALGFVDQAFRVKCRDYAVGRFDWGEAIGSWEIALTGAGQGQVDPPLATMSQ